MQQLTLDSYIEQPLTEKYNKGQAMRYKGTPVTVRTVAADYIVVVEENGIAHPIDRAELERGING